MAAAADDRKQQARSRPMRPLAITAKAVRFDDHGQEDGGAHQAWLTRESFQKYIGRTARREHGESATHQRKIKEQKTG